MKKQRERVWRGLSLVLLRDGYMPITSLEKWAIENKFLWWVVRDVARDLCLEEFQNNGRGYFRLSGKVVPLLPRDIPNPSRYRQAGGAA
jgi:hypothetical protein